MNSITPELGRIDPLQTQSTSVDRRPSFEVVMEAADQRFWSAHEFVAMAARINRHVAELRFAGLRQVDPYRAPGPLHGTHRIVLWRTVIDGIVHALR